MMSMVSGGTRTSAQRTSRSRNWTSAAPVLNTVTTSAHSPDGTRCCRTYWSRASYTPSMCAHVLRTTGGGGAGSTRGKPTSRWPPRAHEARTTSTSVATTATPSMARRREPSRPAACAVHATWQAASCGARMSAAGSGSRWKQRSHQEAAHPAAGARNLHEAHTCACVDNAGMGSYIQILGTPQRACDPQRA